MANDATTVDTVATRVVTYSVRPGSEPKFHAWQDRINQLSAGVPGFRGLEVIAPGNDTPGQWVTLYRYDTEEQLQTWLDSPERADALANAPDIFTAPTSEYTMAGGTDGSSGTGGETLIVSHHVASGHEEEYRAALDELNDAASRFTGFQGVTVLDGLPGSNEVNTMVRFDTKEDMDRWLHSPERAQGREDVYRYTDSHHHKVVATGFGSWFAVNAEDGLAAPAWKQAMVVVSALFPTVMIITMTVGKVLTAEQVGLAPSVFIGNVLGTIALTWLMMPVFARAMNWWLSPRCTGRRTWEGVGLLLAVYATEVALFSVLNP